MWSREHPPGPGCPRLSSVHPVYRVCHAWQAPHGGNGHAEIWTCRRAKLSPCLQSAILLHLGRPAGLLGRAGAWAGMTAPEGRAIVMSEGNTAEPPPVTVPLAGGGELRVDGEGLRLHGHLYRLDQVLDARLLSPYPEVIGMTIAGFAPFTLMSVRPGDGAAALEAIYGRRPELRVAAPPLPPPGAWGAVPPPAFGPQPGIPP